MIAPQPRPGAVWLLDAHNLLHRYYHAAPVETHKGKPVHAVRGVARLITRITAQHEPDSIAVVFDDLAAGHSGRRDLLPEYKQGREPTPEDLAAQIEMARDYLPRARPGCTTIRVEGYEADDVIASLALHARTGGHSVYLITSDKDMLALVVDADPEVAVFNRATGKGAEGWRLYKEADVRDRFGVAPARVLDLLALTGDDSDNVRGVPGVGTKTAADLLRRYGTLDDLLAMLSTVRPDRLRHLLIDHADQIRLARRVLTPVPVPIELISRSLHGRRPPPPPAPHPSPCA